MIANTFEVLAKHLNTYFEQAPSRTFHGHTTVTTSGEDNDPALDIVAFLEERDQQEVINFPLNKVTPILINIEEEKQLRAPDRYARQDLNGQRQFVYPDVRLNLFVLFVCNFHDYTDSLYYVGLIVKFFQSNPVFNHENASDLSPEIEQLNLELITLPFSEQNEVWNAMRSAYHPSLLYKVKLLVFQDPIGPDQAPEISRVETDIKNVDKL